MILQTPPKTTPRPIPRDLPLVWWVTADEDTASDDDPAPPRRRLSTGLSALALATALLTMAVTALSVLSIGGWDAVATTFALP